MERTGGLVTADCVTLWIGESLGPVERACLRSVMRQGHSLALYCYGKPGGIPDGLEVRDANAVLPESRIFRDRRGSLAPFSDWFRYELQRLGAGTWLDTDVYLVRPLDLERPYLFGEEASPRGINNSVLRIPPDSPLLAALLHIFEQRRIPRWMPWRYYLPALAHQLVAGAANLSLLPFGTTGPFALTAAAKRFGLASEALPMDVFNPVPWDRADWVRDPSIDVASVTTDRTVAIHLWNECIKPFKNEPARKGSFLHRLHLEGR